jgi:hypothetical protein
LKDNGGWREWRTGRMNRERMEEFILKDEMAQPELTSTGFAMNITIK